MNEEDPISTAVGSIVNAGALAGAATLVWRAGKVIQPAGVGWRDVEAELPIERDTLFRVASMTRFKTSLKHRSFKPFGYRLVWSTRLIG